MLFVVGWIGIGGKKPVKFNKIMEENWRFLEKTGLCRMSL